MKIHHYSSGRKVGRLRLTFNIEIIHIANVIADIRYVDPGALISKKLVSEKLQYMLRRGGYDKIDVPNHLPTVADYDLAKKLFPELV